GTVYGKNVYFRNFADQSASDAILQVAGDFIIANKFVAGVGIVHFNGGNQLINGLNYHIVAFSNSGKDMAEKTVTDRINASKGIYIGNNLNVNVADGVTGGEIAFGEYSTATKSYAESNGVLTLNGKGWVMVGSSFVSGLGTVVYNGGADQYITDWGKNSLYNNLTISGNGGVNDVHVLNDTSSFASIRAKATVLIKNNERVNAHSVVADALMFSEVVEQAVLDANGNPTYDGKGNLVTEKVAYDYNGYLMVDGEYIVKDSSGVITDFGAPIHVNRFDAGHGTVDFGMKFDGTLPVEEYQYQYFNALNYYNLVLSGGTMKLAEGDFGIENVFTATSAEYSLDLKNPPLGPTFIYNRNMFTVTYNGMDQIINTNVEYYALTLASADAATAVNKTADGLVYVYTDLTFAASQNVNLILTGSDMMPLSFGNLVHNNSGNIVYSGTNQQIQIFGNHNVPSYNADGVFANQVNYHQLTVDSKAMAYADATLKAATLTIRDNGRLELRGEANLSVEKLNSYSVDTEGKLTGFGTVAYVGGKQVISTVETGKDGKVLEYGHLEIGGNGNKAAEKGLVVKGNLSFSADNELEIKSTIEVGALLYNAMGTMHYSATGADVQRVLGGSNIIYNNLKISNGDKRLGGSVVVNGTFEFAQNAGKMIVLDNYELTLGGDITGMNGSAGHYFMVATEAADWSEAASGSENIGWINLPHKANGTSRSVILGTGDNYWSEIVMSNWTTQDQNFVLNITFDSSLMGTSVGAWHVLTVKGPNGSDAATYGVELRYTNAADEKFDPRMAEVYDRVSGENYGHQYASELKGNGQYAFAATGKLMDGFVVTNTKDFGWGSLRRAIDLANAIAGADVITFDPAVFGYGNKYIINVSDAFVITESVTIKGIGADYLTLDGGNSDRIFVISTEFHPDLTVIIEGMTLANGKSNNGGAIYTQGGMLILREMAIRNSNAENGGAVYVDQGATLLVEKSIFSGNSATLGGALYNAGNGSSITAVNTSFIANKASEDGSAIYNNSLVFEVKITDKAGNESLILQNYNAHLVLQNVTISGHDSGVAGDKVATISNWGSMEAYNLTIANNGDAAINNLAYYSSSENILDADGKEIIFQFYADMKLEHVTIAYNKALGVNDGHSYITNSIIQNRTNSAYVDLVINNNNYNLALASNVFAQNMVSDNGGWVQTLKLSDNSTAVNAVRGASLTNYDARGFLV
ncbi:MAG: hypothetical protein RR060_01720, partial [Victivallaceae bacterium]